MIPLRVKTFSVPKEKTIVASAVHMSAPNHCGREKLSSKSSARAESIAP